MCASVLFCASRAGATAAELFGVGAEGRALGGSGLTLPMGYESAFVNPAALALERQPALTLGYSANRYALAVERGTEAVQVPAQGSGDILFGFVLPLGASKTPWVVGFASQSPSHFIVRTDLPPAETPQFPLLVPQSEALDFDLGLGVPIVPWLKLGAGFRALASLNGSVEVTPSSQSSTAHARDTLTPQLAPIFGLLLEPNRSDALALTFHGALRADFAMELSAANLGSTTLPPLEIDGVAAYDPLELAFEYRRRLGELSLLGGLSFRRWSAYPDPLPATVNCPPSRPNCAALPAEHAHFHDTWQPRLAGEYHIALGAAASSRLRAGYAYHPSPIPEQTGETNWLDAARHVLGAGYGVELEPPLAPLAVDLGCELQELVPRTHTKTDASPQNPGFPALKTHGHVESCALSIKVVFQ